MALRPQYHQGLRAAFLHRSREWFRRLGTEAVSSTISPLPFSTPFFHLPEIEPYGIGLITRILGLPSTLMFMILSISAINIARCWFANYFRQADLTAGVWVEIENVGDVLFEIDVTNIHSRPSRRRCCGDEVPGIAVRLLHSRLSALSARYVGHWRCSCSDLCPFYDASIVLLLRPSAATVCPRLSHNLIDVVVG